MIRMEQSSGPLRGLKVVEIGGIGPGPHACMTLADLGADIIRIEPPGGTMAMTADRRHDVTLRGRPNAALDLKHPEAVETVLRLIETADVLVEGMRPGVMERLGLGPVECLTRNPRLVYARMTGWGQDGPLAHSAGHDLSYVAVTGILHGLGQDSRRPHFPTNLLGDYAGGSMYLVVGILAALHERASSGRGDVIDAAIVDGTAHLNALTSAFLADGGLQEQRASNLLDGGTPYYDLFLTADDEHLAVSALEPQFFEELLRLLELPELATAHADKGKFSELRHSIAARIRTRTLQQWTDTFSGTDACVAPVLRLSEAPLHPHLAARGVFVESEGDVQPAPAPRFQRSSTELPRPPSRAGENTLEALAAWGIEDVDHLVDVGAAVQTESLGASTDF